MTYNFAEMTARHLIAIAIAIALISMSSTEQARVGTSGGSQDRNNPLDPVPKSQRPALAKQLVAYTSAFRKKNWANLYDLVADQNKIVFDKLKVSRRKFIGDMRDTYDLERLVKFTPIRTDTVAQGTFDIYGCGELPYGKEKIERIAAVRAVREHGGWRFTNWDYPDPPEPCSNLSDPNWKARNLRLDEPMRQVRCDLYTCTL